MVNKDIEYKVSYLDIPTQAEGFQTVVFIEHGKKYCFVSYANRWGRYFLASDEYTEKIRERMLKEGVKPVPVFDKESRSLINEIISYVNSSKNLEEEDFPISKLLQKISK